MKIAFITMFTLLFVVPLVPPKRHVDVTVKSTTNDSIGEYVKSLDTALEKERKKNKLLRQKCLKEVELIVTTTNGLEKDFHRLAGN